MGLSDVKQKIIEEAEQQAKLFDKQAEEEVKRIQKETEHDASTYVKELHENSERMLKVAERKELAAAEFDGKRAVLEKKKELIAQVIASAQKELEQLSQAEQKKLLKDLLEKAKQEIDVRRVLVNKRDKNLITESGIEVKQTDIAGGLIAETADGRVIVDHSFEALLEQIREKYIQELSEVLFHA